MDAKRLHREDWLRAARRVLLREGPGGVRVERVARELGVTKGSFYWHFRNQGALLDALLAEWEAEAGLLEEALREPDGRGALVRLFQVVQERVLASERGEVPSDAAIFAWAAASPEIAARVNRAEARRIELLQRLSGRTNLAEYVYLAYLGFVMRRRREPAAADGFPRVAEISLNLLAPERGASALLPGSGADPLAHVTTPSLG